MRALASFVLLAVLGCDRKADEPVTKTETVHHGGIDAATARKLADAVKAMQGIGSHERGAFAGAALAELEVGRLPRQLTEAMAELQTVAPEMRSLVAMKALADPTLIVTLDAMCGGDAHGVLGKVAQVGAEEKLAIVWDGCGLARVGLVDRERAESTGLGQLLLACVAQRVLADKGGPSPDETTLLQAFATSS